MGRQGAPGRLSLPHSRSASAALQNAPVNGPPGSSACAAVQNAPLNGAGDKLRACFGLAATNADQQ
eukprot:2439512-Alexandrium_andersonii.AAC.1